MSAYFQFILMDNVSEIELCSDLMRDYIKDVNLMNLDGEKNFWIRLRLHDSGEVDIVTHSIEEDLIFNHLVIDKLDSSLESCIIHKDVMYIVDKKCKLEFRREPPIFLVVSEKIPLALARTEEIREFLEEYNSLGEYIRVKIESEHMELSWFSEETDQGILRSDISIDIGSPEFEDLIRLTRVFKVNILEQM